MSSTSEQTGLTIADKGQINPILMYNGRPALKVGPMPEVDTFVYVWGSDGFDHHDWIDWMTEHGLAYGWLYPESGRFSPRWNQ